jgi:DNA-binding transcriptional MerR regulator
MDMEAPAPDRTLSIGEVARTAGVQASAIRFYEQVHLLPKPPRVGGKRRYHPDTIDRLLMIRFCRRLGFRVSEMRQLFFDPSKPEGKAAWRRAVDARLDEVRATIKAAKAVERVLRESRDCDCVTLDSCRFLREERPKPALRLNSGRAMNRN